jgi:hypothetical protein
MSPGESPPDAGERCRRRLLIVVAWTSVGPDESKQWAHPKRIWRFPWLPRGNLEADRNLGLLPAPVLDCVARDAEPAAVLVVELGVGKDGPKKLQLLRKSFGHRLAPLVADLLAERMAGLDVQDLLFVEGPLSVIFQIDFQHRLIGGQIAERADLGDRDRIPCPSMLSSLNVHARARSLAGFGRRIFFDSEVHDIPFHLV